MPKWSLALDDDRLDVVDLRRRARHRGRDEPRRIVPHYGLRAMRERAEGIGAAVDWADAPNGGCRVHLSVPTTAEPARIGVTASQAT